MTANMSNIWKMNPCQVCHSQFPGPILLKRHMQVKHKSQNTIFAGAEKRKSPFTNSSVSLKQRLDERSQNSSKDLVQANVVQSSTPTLFQKIEQFKASNTNAAEIAFNATFTKKDRVGRTEGLTSPGGKEDPGSVLQCSYCQYQARSVHGLTRHTTGHTGSRKCCKCQKGYAEGSYSSEQYLKLHEASCTGEPRWLPASPGHQEVASTPPLLRNEQENQTLSAHRTEYSDQPPVLSVQVKSEEIKTTPMEVKIEEVSVSTRNSKFEAYISSQALHYNDELKQTVPLYSYNQPQQSQQPQQPQQHLQAPQHEQAQQHLQPKQHQQPLQLKQEQDTGLDETVLENKKPERTQFGQKGQFLNQNSRVTDCKRFIFSGKRYEKYWCMGCKNWLNGGKVIIS